MIMSMMTLLLMVVAEGLFGLVFPPLGMEECPSENKVGKCPHFPSHWANPVQVKRSGGLPEWIPE